MGPTAVDHQAQGGPREQTGRDLEHSSSTCQSGGKGQTDALGGLQELSKLLNSWVLQGRDPSALANTKSSHRGL